MAFIRNNTQISLYGSLLTKATFLRFTLLILTSILFTLYLKGDGGGPLAVANDAGHFHLAGLISWGDECAKV
jgi:hypothetical protein